MTQPPARGQTAPPSSEFGSVTTQRSGSDPAAAGAATADTDTSPKNGENGNGAGGVDGRDTASWDSSPFARGSAGGSGAPEPASSAASSSSASSATTNPSLPTTSDRPGGIAAASYADATTTGSLRTERPPGAPPPGAPVNPAPHAGRSAQNNRAPKGSRSRGPRRARLQLRHINPWTVLKFSCVLSIALFFVWLIVIGVLFGILDGAGIIGKINDTITTINGAGSQAPITAGVVFGGAAIIGVVNIVLFIALSTVGSVVYNLCADLVGGIEITLSER